MDRSATRYKIIGIAPGRTIEGWMDGAPSDARLCQWGKFYRREVQFVIRYFPSMNGWAVLDIRNALQVVLRAKGISIWKGQKRHSVYFPNEDAAVMWAMHQTGTEIAQ